MTRPPHSHPVDAARVERARADALSVAEAERLGSLLALLSDQVRLRVLSVLVSVEELCVSDLALALDVSMDRSSYALKQLRGAGLVQARRAGRVIYYRLADGFPRQSLEHCLRELSTISNREARS